MAQLRLRSGQEIDIELEEDANGSVNVTATKEGVVNHLLQFKSSGYICRNRFIEDRYGFKLDNQWKKIRMVK